MEPTGTSRIPGESEAEQAVSKRTKSSKKTTAQPRPKQERIESPVVFAFRLSETERTKIHSAAGSGKASGFVLAAALAAAAGNVEAFKKVIASRATN